MRQFGKARKVMSHWDYVMVDAYLVFLLVLVLDATLQYFFLQRLFLGFLVLQLYRCRWVVYLHKSTVILHGALFSIMCRGMGVATRVSPSILSVSCASGRSNRISSVSVVLGGSSKG